jgi:hypothetical protein
MDVDHIILLPPRLCSTLLVDGLQHHLQTVYMLEAHSQRVVSPQLCSTPSVTYHASVLSNCLSVDCRTDDVSRYPGVYCLGIMPLSIVRWIAFVQESRHDGVSHMPSAATLASEAIFGLSGFFNVILLLTTKPGSGLFGHLMFISPAPPPLNISDPERSTDNEYRLGKLSTTDTAA